MKDFLMKYLGIIAGSTYALVLRVVFGIHALQEEFDLFSVTFIWITPVVIGLIPLFYASNEQISSWGYRIFSPIVTVILFFCICFLTRIEDLICLWIILLPYVLGALTSGLICGAIIKKIRIMKGTFYSIVLLPFILCPIEQQLETPVKNYSVITKVTIDATPEIIWKNIIRVRDIDEQEYAKGFFNYAGIPRPLYAELDKDTLGAKRIGHFEGGLRFVETVNTWDRNRHIGLDIVVVPSSIRESVFDKHVLSGKHFKFLNAADTLEKQSNGDTELVLASSYQLNTRINPYSSYCGNKMLADFQRRLLNVIKARCEADAKR
jgi:hypothetical protein